VSSNFRCECQMALMNDRGGVFAYTLGWKSIFWFLVILCAVALVPMILYVLSNPASSPEADVV